MFRSGSGRIAAVAVGVVFGVLLSYASFAKKLDFLFFDFAQRNVAVSDGAHSVVVALDEQTFETFGWPLGKDLYAALTAVLHEAGAKRIGFDLFFTERFESCLEEESARESAQKKEELLGSAVAATGAVLASFVMESAGGKSETFAPTPDEAQIPACKSRDAQRFLKPLVPGIADKRPLVAHVHANPSPVDGVVRTIPPCMALHDGCVADLASVMTGKYEHARCGTERYVPFLFSYEDMPRVSFADVIAWSESDEGMKRLNDLVKGKYVLVAATDPTVKDVGATPQAGNEPLVMVHVNRIEALERGIMVVSVPSWVGWGAAALLSFAITMLFRRIVPLLVLAFLCGTASFASAFFLYTKGFFFLPVSSALFPSVLGLGLAAAEAGWRHFLFNRTLSEAFGSYVSPEILKWLRETGGAALKPDAAERREITILFSDIAGYTSLSNALDADKVIRSLRWYLDTMLTIVQEHNGYVDKINGDGLMILFGAPRRSERHAEEAVAAAIAMMKKVEEMQEGWREITGRPLRIRIGIATGSVLVGNLGGSGHIEYSAIGRDVNLAARLESGSEVGGILLSERCWKLLAQKPLGWWREVDLKGYEGKVRVFQIPPRGANIAEHFAHPPSPLILSRAAYDALKDKPYGAITRLSDREGTEREIIVIETTERIPS